jgi:heat shock transcription factor, other eukaryote
MPTPPQAFYQSPTSADQVPAWNGNPYDTVNTVNSYGIMSPVQGQPAQYPQGSAPPASTALARRGVNNQLVAANPSFTQQNDLWTNFDESLIPGQNNGIIDEHDNVEVLEERAQRAKREAQAKRKQIPPFVQKLNR